MLDLIAIGLPALCAFLCQCVAVYALRQKDKAGAREFSAFAASVMVWCFFVTLEQIAPTYGWRVLCGKIAYAGTLSAPVCWVLFCTRYTGNNWWLSRNVVAALFALPFVSFVLALTNGYHHLVWSDITIATEPRPHLLYEHGPWFSSIILPYSYSAMTFGMFTLMYTLFADIVGHRRPLVMLLIAVILVSVGNIAYLVYGFDIGGVDPTPLSITVLVFIIGLTIFRDQFQLSHKVSYRGVFENSIDAIVLIDNDGLILESNLGADMLADGESGAKGPFTEAFPLFDGCLNITPDQTALVRHDMAYIQVKVAPLEANDGSDVGKTILMRDVTADEIQKAELKNFAYKDSLTGVANRRRLLDYLAEKTCHKNQRFALLYADLDDFKLCNDTHGHQVGDAVLQYVAGHLQAVCGHQALVARLGGDEFVAVVDVKDRDEAQSLIDRLARVFERRAVLEGVSLTTCASLGFSLYPDDGQSARQLMRKADDIMYKEKHEKRELRKA